MSAPDRLSAEAIVVGSGASGAPVAAVLAEAGFDVVLLEAGPRVETREFNGDEGEMTAKLWKMGFAVDSGLSVYAGACVGGSTVINDALCFRTPPEVLERWRRDHGLAGLTDAAFAPFVERAWLDLHAEETGHLRGGPRPGAAPAGTTFRQSEILRTPFEDETWPILFRPPAPRRRARS